MVLKKVAGNYKITLFEQEKNKALKLSKIFYDENVANTQDFPELSREDCDTVFLDYFLVNKTKKNLIEKNVKEVSESEARIMDFYVIEVSDYELATTLLERLNNGENCVKLANQFSESDDIKNALSVLVDGGISPIVTDKGKYMLYKCVKGYNEDATRRNKKRIKEERESAYLLNLYNNYAKENPIDINESEFEKVCKSPDIVLSGRDFFTLWSEEENGGL